LLWQRVPPLPVSQTSCRRINRRANVTFANGHVAPEKMLGQLRMEILKLP
jgi:hypothetical protein